MRRLAAVLGRDVSRSLSPRLHAAAAEVLGLEIAYVPVSCPDPAGFREAVRALEVLGAVGANVTVPYKRAALELAGTVSTTAREIGAVNTLTFAEGRLFGDNTDGPGLLRALERLPDRALERVQLLGAGGAARAAAWALARLGAGEVVVTARRNANFVAELAGGVARTLERVPGVTLVISSLPGDRGVARQALSDWIDTTRRPIVYDLAYGTRLEAVEGRADPQLEPEHSPLVLAAKLEGLTAADGRRLLVEQAALSLSLWTGVDLPRLRSAMGLALGLRLGSPSGDSPF